MIAGAAFNEWCMLNDLDEQFDPQNDREEWEELFDPAL